MIEKPHVQLRHVVDEPDTWNPPTSGSRAPFRYIDISSVDAAEKRIVRTSTILPLAAPSRARQLVRAGDVLVSTVRPNLNAVALVDEELDGATASTGFAVLRPKTLIEPGYLFHWVRTSTFVRYVAARATGASYPAVTERTVRESRIPLPPLTEQRRISAVLDKADAVRRKRRESLRQFDDFIRSAFLELFGDAVKHPNAPLRTQGWNLTNVSALAAEIEHACAGGPFGSSLTRSDYIEMEGVPVIRGNNLVAEQGVFRDEGFVFVSAAKADELHRNIARSGDLVFTQRGTLGQVARIPLSARYPRYVVSQSQMKLTPNEAIVDPTYLVHYFLSPRARIDLASRTLATGVPHINLSILKAFPVIVPPLDLQHRFALIASQHLVVAARAAEASCLAERLADSIAHVAFAQAPMVNT